MALVRLIRRSTPPFHSHTALLRFPHRTHGRAQTIGWREGWWMVEVHHPLFQRMVYHQLAHRMMSHHVVQWNVCHQLAHQMVHTHVVQWKVCHYLIQRMVYHHVVVQWTLSFTLSVSRARRRRWNHNTPHTPRLNRWHAVVLISRLQPPPRPRAFRMDRLVVVSNSSQPPRSLYPPRPGLVSSDSHTRSTQTRALCSLPCMQVVQPTLLLTPLLLVHHRLQSPLNPMDRLRLTTVHQLSISPHPFQRRTRQRGVDRRQPIVLMV